MAGLYVIVDPERCLGRDPVDIGRQALQGGCAMLQLRAKAASARRQLELACALRAACDRYGVPFWVNDRPDIARLARAHGVHVGQDDLPVVELRRAFPELAIGLSTHSLEQAQAAQAAKVDLVGFGPIFETRSKENPDPVVGVRQLAQVCTSLRIPVVAIGGLTADTAAQVASTGCAWAAVIGAVGQARDPQAATEQLVSRLVNPPRS